MPSFPHPPPRRAQRPVAVALSHQFGGDALPRVVASGRGHVAEQILQVAFANGVKVRQDADLAGILAAIDVDSEIPIAAIAAVAEILARVYQANGRMLNQAEAVFPGVAPGTSPPEPRRADHVLPRYRPAATSETDLAVSDPADALHLASGGPISV